MNKVTLTNPASQEQITKETTVSKGFFLHNKLISLSNRAIRLLYNLRGRSRHVKLIFARQDTLGRSIGLNRQEVNAAAKELHDAGLIDKEKRSGAQTCIYHLSAWTKDKKNQKYIAYLFMCFSGFFAINLLVSKPAPRRIMTQLRNNYNKTGTLSPRKRYPNGQRRQEGIDEAKLFVSFYLKNKQQQPSVQSVPPLETRVPVVTFKKEEPNIERVNQMTTTTIIFNEAHLEEISHHTQEIYDATLKVYNRDIANGKVIQNPSGYFMAIFRGIVSKQQQPKTGTSKPTFKQAAQPKAEEYDPEARDIILNDRITRINAKAIEMNIPDAEYRTAGEKVLIFRGYELPPVSEERKKRADMLKELPAGDFQGVAKMLADKFTAWKTEPIKQAKKFDMNGLDTLQDVFFKLKNDAFPKPEQHNAHNTDNSYASNEPELGADELAIDFDDQSDIQWM